MLKRYLIIVTIVVLTVAISYYFHKPLTKALLWTADFLQRCLFAIYNGSIWLVKASWRAAVSTAKALKEMLFLLFIFVVWPGIGAYLVYFGITEIDGPARYVMIVAGVLIVFMVRFVISKRDSMIHKLWKKL